MTVRMQKRLAIGIALALVALLFAYKAVMVSAAFTSRTACVVVDETSAARPALRAC